MNSVLTPNCFLHDYAIRKLRLASPLAACVSAGRYIYIAFMNRLSRVIEVLLIYLPLREIMTLLHYFPFSPSLLITFCPSVTLLLSGVAVGNKIDVSRIQTATMEPRV